MMSRSLAKLALALALGVLCATLGTPAGAMADPASELAAAEESEAAASAELGAAEQAVDQAERELAPIARHANRADQAASEAVANAGEIRDELVAERTEAAKQIEAAESDYDSERSHHSTTTGVGIGLAAAALVLGLAAFAYSRFRNWPLAGSLTWALGGGLVFVFVGGLVLAFVPSEPEEPHFSDEMGRLAADAKGNPAEPPTPKLSKARAEAKPLVAKAKPLDRERRKAAKRVADAEEKADHARGELREAKSEVKVAQRAVQSQEREVEEEQRFRDEATTIDYDQLKKNADRYRGEKVVYTGQIFQIQEFAGGGIILLAVTDEGYGFWDDNIWVDFHEPLDAAEEDIITVYGKITGSKEYETQIGGSTYVPRMNAKYIDE